MYGNTSSSGIPLFVKEDKSVGVFNIFSYEISALSNEIIPVAGLYFMSPDALMSESVIYSEPFTNSLLFVGIVGVSSRSL